MAEPYVTITMPIEAEGKRAHNSRVVFKNGKPFVMHYPDPKMVAHEAAIAKYARIAVMGLPLLRGEAVSIAIEAHFVPPKSWSKRGVADALAGRMAHLSKPDWDNVAKSVCDAFKGIVWDDDSRVVMGQVQKSWAAEPMIRVTIWKWFEDVPADPEQRPLIGDFV